MYKVYHQGNHIHDLTDEEAETAWPGGRIASFSPENRHHIISKSMERKEIIIEFLIGGGRPFIRDMQVTIWVSYEDIKRLAEGGTVTAYSKSLDNDHLIEVLVPAKWIKGKASSLPTVSVNSLPF